MPDGFTTGVPTDVWTPLRPSTDGEGGGTNYGMIARVAPGRHLARRRDAEINQLGSPAIMRGYQNGRQGRGHRDLRAGAAAAAGDAPTSGNRC